MKGASGYIIQDGVVRGETHQCSHCQYTWEHKPGSGARRGFCTSCNSHTCGREYCRQDQVKKLESFKLTRAVCIPFYEYNERLVGAALKAENVYGKLGDGFVMSEFGIVIPRPI